MKNKASTIVPLAGRTVVMILASAVLIAGALILMRTGNAAYLNDPITSHQSALTFIIKFITYCTAWISLGWALFLHRRSHERTSHEKPSSIIHHQS